MGVADASVILPCTYSHLPLFTLETIAFLLLTSSRGAGSG